MLTGPSRLGTRVARPPVGQRPRAASREGPASPWFWAVPLDDLRRELGSFLRCGWFVESIATELAVMLVLRTNRRFWLSKTGRALLVTSIAGAAITFALPYSPVAGVLGVTAVLLGMVAALAAVTVGYIGVNELVKARTGLAA